MQLMNSNKEYNKRKQWLILWYKHFKITNEPCYSILYSMIWKQDALCGYWYRCMYVCMY